MVARRAGRALRAAFLQRGHQSGHPRVHQRRQPEHQTRRDRHAECEEQDERIDRDLGRARQARRVDADERLHAGACEHEAEQAADDREQDALGHELAQEPATAGAERGPDRELAMPVLGAGEEQVGQVGAGDQQDEADRRLQNPDRAARAADDLLLHRLHLQDVPRSWIRRAVGGLAGRSEDVILHANPLAPVLNQRRQFGLRRLRRRRRPSGVRSDRGNGCRDSGDCRDSGRAAARSRCGCPSRPPPAA